jgi:hypothetical protein
MLTAVAFVGARHGPPPEGSGPQGGVPLLTAIAFVGARHGVPLRPPSRLWS